MDPALIQARLTEAESAYHVLMTRGGVARLQHGIEDLQYNPASADKLRLYINDLRSQLGIAPMSPPRTAWRRPFWV